MTEMHGISLCTPTEIVFNDGSRTPHPDVIIFATGYCLSFPYLQPQFSATIDQDMAFPLYKQFISIRRPSVFLFGVCINVAPFPLFFMQAQFALAIIEGRHSLPSRQQMLSELRAEVRTKMPERLKSIHVQTHEQWALTSEMARVSGVSPLPPQVAGVFYRSDYMRRKHLMYYRSYTFDVDNMSGRVHMRPLNGAQEIPEALQVSSMPNAVLKITGNRKEITSPLETELRGIE